MKRILALVICVLLVSSLVGCSTNNQRDGKKDELYAKAITVLDEFKDKQEVKDFLEAYNLLTTLSNNEDKFIDQLHKVNAIYSKYNVELDNGNYYLGKSGTFAIDDEGIKKYKSEGAYNDANLLMEKLIYPILFEKYGDNAHNIEGLKSNSVIDAIESTKLYSLKEENKHFDTTNKEYQFNGDAKANYEVTYHPNGLVESVTVPIAISGNPFSDNDYAAFFQYDLEKQKDVAGNRFVEMQSSFTNIACGYEVLSLIYDADELNVIANYVHSLTKNNIWERNFLESENVTSYITAMVYFSYKDTNVCINYGLNSIELFITGKNYINTLSHKWHTVWLGLCHKAYGDDILNDYKDYLDNNTESNNEIAEYKFNLDENEDDFKTALPSQSTDGSNDDVQTSVPVELSVSQPFTITGVIEKNDTAFPTYRLRISPRLSIIFTDDESDAVYECDYLYFYDDPEYNDFFEFEQNLGSTCEVRGRLEDYRGGGELFFLNAKFSVLQ